MIIDLYACERDMVCSALASLEHELFGVGAWSEMMIRQELNAPDRAYVLDVEPTTHDAGAEVRVDQPSRIRGYAGFWYDGDDAELMTIGVAKAYQRRGIAAAMLNRLIELASARNAHRMLLEVRVDNEPALRLYRRFGFTRMGLRKRYYQPENVDAYTMSLELGPPPVVGFAVPDGTDHADP